MFGGLLVVINYQFKKKEVGVIILKNIESQLVIGSNEYVADTSLLS